MTKRLTALVMVFVLTVSNAYASILGSTLVENSSLLVAHDTILYKNTFKYIFSTTHAI